MSLQKARDHGMEPRVAGHIIAKMEEAHPLCARWKTEAAAWCEEAMQKAEDAWQVEEEWRAAPSVLFQLTRLLGGEVASGKGKGKGKAHALVHAPNRHMSVVQCKVSIRSNVPFFGLTKFNPALSLVHSERRRCRCRSSRWSTCAR